MSLLRSLLPSTGRPATERRVASRLRTRLRPGKLARPDGSFLADVAILDRNGRGFRLHLFEALDLPGTLAVFDERQPWLHPVRLVWQRGREAGVALAGMPAPLEREALQRLSGRYYAVGD